jgi:antitoxin component of MazEF toxin-antitoxin module
MSEVFEAKIRKIGNSLGVIIPAEILEDLHVDKDDTVSVCIPQTDINNRNKRLRKIAGIDSGKPGFKREKEDRY